MIELENVNKKYPQETGGTFAVNKCTLSIASGDFVAIIGKSGSGKTTLLNLIGCLDNEYSGRIVIDGHDLKQLSDGECSRLRNETIGFVFQEFHLLDHLTVRENITLPSFFTRGHPQNTDTHLQQITKSLELDHVLEQKPAHLSGGQRQRVAIARALIRKPKLLLCDEPTGSLDSNTGAEVLKMLEALNQEGYTIVMITHDPNVACIAHRTIRIQDGQIELGEADVA